MNNVFLQIYRGTTQVINFNLGSIDPANVTRGRFAIRKTVESPKVLEKDSIVDATAWDFTNGTLVLSPTDTQSIDGGTYVYDLKITEADGTVTAIQYGRVLIIADVANDNP